MEKLERVEFAIELLKEMLQKAEERYSRIGDKYEDSRSYTCGYCTALNHSINLLETALKE